MLRKMVGDLTPPLGIPAQEVTVKEVHEIYIFSQVNNYISVFSHKKMPTQVTRLSLNSLAGQKCL